MAKVKLTLSTVFKKDLKVLIYLLVFGGVTYLSGKYLVSGEYAILLGGAANYLLFRLEKELANEGYVRALKS